MLKTYGESGGPSMATVRTTVKLSGLFENAQMDGSLGQTKAELSPLPTGKDWAHPVASLRSVRIPSGVLNLLMEE